MSTEFKLTIAALVTAIMSVILLSAMEQGRENDACRQRGNLPVKTDKGWVCVAVKK